MINDQKYEYSTLMYLLRCNYILVIFKPENFSNIIIGMYILNIIKKKKSLHL